MSTIDPLFPGTVAVEEEDPAHIEGTLHPEEAALIGKAGKRRTAEFTAGRLLAHRALERLGADQGPILRGDNGQPLWPEGIVGSIAHKSNLCVAVAAKTEDVLGLGVDVEDSKELKEELFDRICTPNELTWLEGKNPSNHGLLGKILFSAKECVYKCLFPLNGEFLSFDEVEIEPDLVEGTFLARVLGKPNHGWPKDAGVLARWRIANGKVVTTITVVP